MTGVTRASINSETASHYHIDEYFVNRRQILRTGIPMKPCTRRHVRYETVGRIDYTCIKILNHRSRREYMQRTQCTIFSPQHVNQLNFQIPKVKDRLVKKINFQFKLIYAQNELRNAFLFQDSNKYKFIHPVAFNLTLFITQHVQEFCPIFHLFIKEKEVFSLQSWIGIFNYKSFLRDTLRNCQM